LSSKQEREARPAADQEEATPDPEQPSASAASAAETSAKAAGTVDAIDDVLDEFDSLTLAELGFKKEEAVDRAKVDEAIKEKVKGFIQKGGQ
jgi:hypothetical protein